MQTSHPSVSLRGALFVLLVSLTSGCGVSARFYSKTGQQFPSLVGQAVVCNEQEADLVARAGGEPIGSIAGEGLVPNATEDDVIEKAAKVAGKKGGTHIVLTDRGEETFTYNNPATKEKRCTWNDGVEDCQWVYQPATTSTRTEPTARFIVLRVPPERWGALPQSLRPIAAD